MGYGIGDITNYVLFSNPLSRGMINGVHTVVTHTGIANGVSAVLPAKPTPQIIPSLYELSQGNSIFLRIAALSGASCYFLQSYYDINRPQENDSKINTDSIFHKTNNMQIINTIALLAIPLTKNPKFAGSMMTIGIALYCGSGYYQTFKGKQNKKLDLIMLWGKLCLFFGWLSIVR